MLEIEQAKTVKINRINSARVNLKNESNSVFGGRKEFNEPIASKKVMWLTSKNSNQFSIIGTNVDKEI